WVRWTGHEPMNTRSLEDIAERLAALLPPQLGAVHDELRDNFHAVLQSQLARLDLVPREEFEATREMLVHTRQKLEALEQQVAELEGRSAGSEDEIDQWRWPRFIAGRRSAWMRSR